MPGRRKLHGPVGGAGLMIVGVRVRMGMFIVNRRRGPRGSQEMEPLVGIAVIVAGLVATVALLLLAVLALRHPGLPAWLQTEGAVQTACFVLTALLASAISASIASLVQLEVPINVYGAVGLTAGVMLATAYLICILGHVGERLRRADAGCSPFAALPQPEHRSTLGLSPR